MLARLLGLLAAVAALLVLAAPAPATSIAGTNTFTGGSIAAPHDWNDAGNWSQGEVPDGADDVVIASGRVVYLTSGASGVAKTLDNEGSLTIDGGNVAGGRSLTLGSGTSTIAGTLTVLNGAVLNLGTTTNWTTGNVGVGGTGGATVNIGAGDVLDVTGDVSSSNWVGGLWNNQGTINRTTGTGTAAFNNAVENDGAINVSSGKLSLAQGDGAGASSGTYTAAAGATLQFFGGNYELTGAASVGGAGTVENYAATVVVGAGVTFDPGALGLTGWGTLQLDASGSTGNLNAVGGTRSGSGTLTVNGAMSVGSSGVTFKGAGTTTVTGASTINATTFNVVDGHTLNLGSTTTWNTGTIGVGGTGGATVNIGAGDVLNIPGDVSSGNWGSGLWHNQGTINRTTSAGTASFDNAVENDGAINVNSGTLTLKQGDGAGTSSGTYTAAAGATLTFSGGVNDLTAAASVNGAGTVRFFGSGTTVVASGATFNPGALDFAGGTLQLDTAGTTGSLTATNGSRTGSGALSVSGAMSVSLTFTLQGSGTTSVGGTTTLNGSALYVLDGHTLNLGPTTNWSTGIVGVGGLGDSTVNVGAGDVLNITGDVNTQGTAGGHWNNAGTINRTTTSGTAHFFRPVTSSGTINVHTGTLSFDSGLTQTAGVTSIDAGTTLGGGVALQGGVLKGTGTASGDVTNTGGTVAPGASPGKLSIGGDYSQSGGTLEAQIAGTGQGTSYDWLAVAGSVKINGGTLAIVTDPQFDPAATDTFDIVTSGATQTASGGGFTTVSGAALSGRSYVVQMLAGPPGKVRLGFSLGPQNIVAPSIPASAHPGDSVACDPGTWTGSPTSVAFAWLRDGSVIAGATGDHYTITSDDVGKSIRCQVTATNGAGSTYADSDALVPAASPPPPPPPPPATTPKTPPAESPPTGPSSVAQTVRGDAAFTEGASNDLYLACTKLDLLLIDVLPAGRRTVSVTGTADLRLAGETADILLDGKRVGRAAVGADGSFAATVPAPAANRRMHARYQARIGATASQRLRLARRMVATTLTRSGSSLVLRGRITGPFAARPAAIAVQRFLSCRRQEKVAVVKVVPDRSGNFAVKIPAPTGAKAAIYRALTNVASHPRGNATVHTFTLPRAIDL